MRVWIDEGALNYVVVFLPDKTRILVPEKLFPDSEFGSAYEINRVDDFTEYMGKETPSIDLKESSEKDSSAADSRSSAQKEIDAYETEHLFDE